MNYFLNIDPLNTEGILIALFCGVIIGFERQWSGKPAGIRTSILICLSAYIFVRIANYYQEYDEITRIVGQIVTGVGFLGAGVIIAREGLILGVTSAAVIWILAAVGCLIGLKSYNAAISISVLSVIVLVGITFLEKVVKKLKTGVHQDTEKEETN